MTVSDSQPQNPLTEVATRAHSPGKFRGQMSPDAPAAPACAYRRYHIEAELAADLVPLPPRFRVRVNKHRLIGMALKELVTLKGDIPVALSRPCVYGVFSRPVGGLAPREELCVGCLRCTVQYPDVVQIYPNPARQHLGNTYIRPEEVDAILYEARTGRVPVRGAGYRGTFGGEGWDGLWTDMSEIVRPTRDGIHGREFISTIVDIGERPAYLRFDERGEISVPTLAMVTSQLPFLFDLPVDSACAKVLLPILAEAARQLETLVLAPIDALNKLALAGRHIVPIVTPAAERLLDRLGWEPAMIVLDGWDRERFTQLRERLPNCVICVHVPMDADVLELTRQGARVLYLTADYHGYAGEQFAMDLILRAHQRLVDAGVREEVTLLGGGGIVLAEHVPKAIICGLDAVTLDVALAVALQASFSGEGRNREPLSLAFPRMQQSWGVQRLKNLAASWRDQLLEILGAMGMREVRRLRGELGRCMFQRDLERDIFGAE